ncbi:MAG: hypothetical protein RLZZ616_3299, partial [Pseudomonadota bacterium]
LLEDIAVGHGIAYGKAIHQHRHLDGEIWDTHLFDRGVAVRLRPLC